MSCFAIFRRFLFRKNSKDHFDNLSVTITVKNRNDLLKYEKKEEKNEKNKRVVGRKWSSASGSSEEG